MLQEARPSLAQYSLFTFVGAKSSSGPKPVYCQVNMSHDIGPALITLPLMMTSSNGNIFRVTGPLYGEFTGHGEFPAQRPVTRSFGVFFDLRLNKR